MSSRIGRLLRLSAAAVMATVGCSNTQHHVNSAPAEYPSAWSVKFVASQPLPADYAFGQQTTTFAKGTTYPPASHQLPCDITLDRDVAVSLRDGTVIYTDILRPADNTAKLPTIVAWSPYGKTIPATRLFSDDVPSYWLSGLAKGEGPDPGFWACNGYAVANVDPRGVGRSAGDIHFWGTVDGNDGYDVIEWIAAQPWSNGKVGLHGTSWLAIAQWFIAATKPPHLAAIAPWNGFTDVYRDHVAVGGIPATGFMSGVTQSLAGQRRTEAPKDMLDASNGLINSYWQDKSAKLEDITTPAYVGADGATLLHRTGNTEGFRRISSPQKWLRINDTHEWHDQYDPRNEVDLLRFFDHFLKGVDNGWETTPRVRIDVLDAGGNDKPQVPYADWPIPDTSYTKYYLDAGTNTLDPTPPPVETTSTYDAQTGQVSYTITFTQDTQIVGYLKSRLYVEAAGANDMDLYVEVQKLAEDRTVLVPSERFTTAYQGYRVTGDPGQQRVSLRKQDPVLATDFRPAGAFSSPEPLSPGQVIPVDIAILPQAQLWHAGQRLRLNISGKQTLPIATAPGLPTPPSPSVNAGTHIIHTGGHYASYLQLPLVPATQ